MLLKLRTGNGKERTGNREREWKTKKEERGTWNGEDVPPVGIYVTIAQYSIA